MKRFLAGAVLALVACAAQPDDAAEPRLVVADIDPAAYATAVQPVVERKCGSLDCHGHTARGLRVYGQNGLRIANTAGRTPGEGATTPEEARATYQSILALQPEKTNAFAAKSPRTAEDAYDLTFLAKPLQLERHRPGRSLAKGEPAEQCITSWLVGTTDAAICTSAVKAPSPSP